MAVITISRQFGTGGKALGMMIADELGYDFADNDIIQRHNIPFKIPLLLLF